MRLRYLLDTNICIYIAKNRPDAVLNRFKQLSVGEVAMSVITHGELCYGACKSRRREEASSPHFSPDFVARRCRRAWIQGARPRVPQAYSTVRRGARPSATQ